MKRIVERRAPAIAILMLVSVVAGGMSHRRAGPVTLVSIPWAEARLDGGEPFIIPSTVVLEPGEYRLVIERSGYRPVERVLQVGTGGPENHLFRLERR